MNIIIRNEHVHQIAFISNIPPAPNSASRGLSEWTNKLHFALPAGSIQTPKKRKVQEIFNVTPEFSNSSSSLCSLKQGTLHEILSQREVLKVHWR